MSAAGARPEAAGTILQGGRRKAYRPLPEARRRAAIEEGLEAYARGDYFEAHELLEPAWMGTANLAERDLLQGLIKLAAAHVHAARGNRDGVRKNFLGAAARIERGRAAAAAVGVDVDRLLSSIKARLGELDHLPAMERPSDSLLRAVSIRGIRSEAGGRGTTE